MAGSDGAAAELRGRPRRAHGRTAPAGAPDEGLVAAATWPRGVEAGCKYEIIQVRTPHIPPATVPSGPLGWPYARPARAPAGVGGRVARHDGTTQLGNGATPCWT
ncbi:hypothetical protein GCM10009551_044760 [Nocardiopsis tropica]